MPRLRHEHGLQLSNGAAAIRGAYLDELGIRTENIQALADRMAREFTVEDWGYRQFAELDDPKLRAIVSDQTWSSTDAVLTNLVEARVHELDFNELIGSRGVRRASSVRDYYRDTRIDMHIAGFFRAFGSALDCLAGTITAVARLPYSIHKASMSRNVFNIDPAAATTDEAREVWQDILTRIDTARAGPPTNWMDWALQFRHALVHRPRQINMMVPRPRESRITLPPSAIWDVLRFDLYLRRKPWLPEMEHLSGPDPNAEELFLAEPATQTLRGLFERLNDAVEALAPWLLELWERHQAGETDMTIPVARWGQTDDLDVGFAAIDPGEVNAGDLLFGNPLTTIRLQLAERLRQLEV